jgi:serpin B
MSSRVRVSVLSVVAVALTVLFAAGCSSESREEGFVQEVTDEDISLLANGEGEFALDLYKNLAGEGNLFFSPLSIAEALSMTAAGARGDTEYEMESVLHFPRELSSGVPMFVSRENVAASYAGLSKMLVSDEKTGGYELSIANRLWGQKGYPFLQPYVDLVEASYGAALMSVDFAGKPEEARSQINEWAKQETQGKIENVVPEGGIDSMTTLVLTNAVYFKGLWEHPFNKDATKDDVFHGVHADATAPFMHQTGTFQYGETDYAQIIELPYKGDELSMLIVLPKTNQKIDLRMLEKMLSPDTLDEWQESLHEMEVDVYVPRFEMTWGTEDIARQLQALGMTDAFVSGVADFSGMTERNDLFISNVFHKAYVAVDEEGTEAAAATAVVMKRMAIQQQTVFRADRPFTFMITHNKTGAVLFMGRLVDY